MSRVREVRDNLNCMPFGSAVMKVVEEVEVKAYKVLIKSNNTLAVEPNQAMFNVNY